MRGKMQGTIKTLLLIGSLQMIRQGLN